MRFRSGLAVVGVTLAAASPAGAALAPESEAPSAPALPAVIAYPCSFHGMCGGTLNFTTVAIGAVARPAVQRPALAPPTRQVLRPTRLVPGQLRAGRR